MWLWGPWGSLQTGPCVSRVSQRLDSGARPRPPNWESNQRRSVGTSCLTGPWPWGARPMSGSCTVLWPTYHWWEGDSHLLTYEAEHQLHLQTADPLFAMLTFSPVTSDEFNDLLNSKSSFRMPTFFMPKMQINIWLYDNFFFNQIYFCYFIIEMTNVILGQTKYIELNNWFTKCPLQIHTRIISMLDS